MERILRGIPAVLLAVILAAAMSLAIGGITAQAVYADDESGIALNQVFFGDLAKDKGWAWYFSVDGKDTELALADLGIQVEDENGDEVDADAYDVSIDRVISDKDGDSLVPVEEPYGIEDDGMGFTEYRATITAKDDSDYTGKLEATFFIMDRYSLNWICAEITIQDYPNIGWRFMEYFQVPKGALADLGIAPNVESNNGSQLVKDEHYTLTFYRRGEGALDDPNLDIEDFLIADEGYKVDETIIWDMSEDAGGYFARIEGIAPYYGTHDIILDIDNHVDLELAEGEDEGPLWSDQTRKYKVSVPEGYSNLGELWIGVGIYDWEEGGWNPLWGDINQPDGCFTYVEGPEVNTGVLELQGDRISEKLGRNGEIDIGTGYMDGPEPVRTEGIKLQIRQVKDEKDFPEDMVLLPEWEEWIDSEYEGYLEDSEHPEGVNYTIDVTDAEIIDEDPAEEGGTVLSLEDHDGSWCCEAVDYGTAVIRLHYLDINGEEQTWDFNVTVADTSYDVELWPESGVSRGLPGSSITLCAQASKSWYDPDAEPKYDESDEGLVYHWSLEDGDRFAEIEPVEGDPSKAVVTFYDMPEDWDSIGEEIVAKVSVTDENADDQTAECTSKNISLWVEDDFYQIEPATIESDLDVGSSLIIEPKLVHYKLGSDPVEVEDVNFTWQADDADVVDIDIDDSSGKHTLTRKEPWPTDLQLVAAWKVGDKDMEVDQWYQLDNMDYSFWFDNDDPEVYSDGTLNLQIEADFDLDRYDIDYTVGLWDDSLDDFGETFTEGTEYTVDENGVITLDGAALWEWVKTEENPGISVLAELKNGGTTLEYEYAWVTVREASIEYYPEEDQDMLPGSWHFISNIEDGFVQNGEYPDGEDFEYEITNVSLESQTPETEGETVLQIDPDDDGQGWDLKAVSYGTAVVKVAYNDIDGNPMEPYTFQVNVVHDIYGVEINLADGSSWKALPEGEIHLIANGWHDAAEGEGTEDDFTYQWRLEDGAEDYATVTPDTKDSSKAVVTFHDIDEEEFQKSFNVYVDLYDGEEPDPKASNEIGLNVSTSYVEILPTEIGNVYPGKSIVIKPTLRYYEAGKEGYEVIDDAEFSWDEYDEAKVEIEENEDGSFTITRLTSKYIQMRLVAEWDADGWESEWYSLSDEEYWMDFDSDEYEVGPGEQVQATIDTSELGDWDYDIQFEAGYKNDENVWVQVDDDVFTVSDDGTGVTVKGNKLIEKGLDGVNIHAMLMYGNEKITDAWCWIECNVECDEHDLVHVDAKPATCIETGNTEYWQCQKCGRRFSDEAGTDETTPEATTLAIDPDAHDWELKETTPATCSAPGSKKYVCKRDSSHTKTEVIQPDLNAHDWGEPSYEWSEDNSKVTATRVCKNNDTHKETETVATTSEVTGGATCVQAGEITYTSAAFANPAFAVQTKKVAIPADTNAHDWGTPSYEWSEDNSKVTATRVCKNNDTHKETETVAATSAVTVEATCQQAGEITYTSAAFDNPAFAVQTKKVATDKAVHSLKKVAAVPATCNKEGSKEHWKCEVCGSLFWDEAGQDAATEAEVEIPVDTTAHDWGDPSYAWSEDFSKVTATRVCKNKDTHKETETVATTSAVTVEATCEKAGEVVYTSAAFANPAFAVQTKKVATDKAAHSLTKIEKVPATCTESGNIEYYSCGVCKKLFSDAAGTKEITEKDTVIEAAGHVWDEGAVSKEPTLDSEGEMTYTCTVCHTTRTETIPKMTPAEGGKYVSPDGSVVEILSVTDDGGTVAYAVAGSGDNIEIPGAVEIQGKIYLVTVIRTWSFKGVRAKKATAGPNIQVIEKLAFKGSTIKTLIVKTRLLTKASVKGALKGSQIKTIKVKVGNKKLNKKYAAKYKKFFTKKNAGGKAAVK